MALNLQISRLISGGLITNYYCTSECGHCLYACSPRWKKKYIEPEDARKYFRIIKSFGCNSIHIGGGEPMLKPDSLKDILKIALEEDMGIDYVETNSSWFKDERSAAELLNDLRAHGLQTLLISISPFHNEHIPFNKVKGVISACQKSGINVFPWIRDFYPEIDSFDDKSKHSLNDYKKKFGDDYVKNIPDRYWTHFGGRAVETFKNILPLKSLGNIINSHNRCNELSDTSHFHIDLFGNYIPGLCSGFSILSTDLGKKLEPEKYPLLNMLYSNGVKSLLSYAVEKYNFQPEKQYLNKCHLCLDIRKFFISKKNLNFVELQPAEYYSNLNINQGAIHNTGH